MSDSASSFAKSKIYTKTGDAGTSSLYNGTRRPKTDPVFDALGHTDELNAHIGIAREYCIAEQNALDERLAEIQSRLMDVGSHVATPIKSSQTTKIERTAFSEAHVDRLENWIDQLDSELPPLKNFILPVNCYISIFIIV
jgi:ATP:cob(I)alamin adenosyltransferase